jgi:hypothetical protein
MIASLFFILLVQLAFAQQTQLGFNVTRNYVVCGDGATVVAAEQADSVQILVATNLQTNARTVLSNGVTNLISLGRCTSDFILFGEDDSPDRFVVARLSDGQRTILSTNSVSYSYAEFLNSSHIVYLAGTTQFGLYVQNIDGSPATTLLGNMGAGTSLKLLVSPDKSTVVVRKPFDSTVVELYRVIIASNSSAKLNPTLGLTEDVTDFLISGDSQWAVFYVDGTSNTGLYKASLSSGANTLLSAGVWVSFAVSPTGNQVVYRGGNVLRTQSLSGGAATDLTLNAVSDSFLTPSYQFSPSGEHIFYHTSDKKLFRYTIVGGVTTELSVAGAEVDYIKVSPDGARVLYGNETRLFSVSATASDAMESVLLTDTPISLAISVSFGFHNIFWSPDSSKIAYTRSLGSGNGVGLFVTPAAGANNVQISDNSAGSNGVVNNGVRSPTYLRVQPTFVSNTQVLFRCVCFSSSLSDERLYGAVVPAIVPTTTTTATMMTTAPASASVLVPSTLVLLVVALMML